MSKKVQISVEFDREHEYIQKNGDSELTVAIGVNLAINCYGFVIASGIYCELDGHELLTLTAEMCNAAHRLLVENEDAFMDEVFGAEFNAKHGITKLELIDYDEVLKQMHRKIIEDAMG